MSPNALILVLLPEARDYSISGAVACLFIRPKVQRNLT